METKPHKDSQLSYQERDASRIFPANVGRSYKTGSAPYHYVAKDSPSQSDEMPVAVQAVELVELLRWHLSLSAKAHPQTTKQFVQTIKPFITWRAYTMCA